MLDFALMCRWLSIFLLAILPLQASWVVVAAYCGHESDPRSAQHFGHHGHDHGPNLTSVADGSPPAAGTGAGGVHTSHKDGMLDSSNVPAAADLDCAYCHGLGAAVLNFMPPPAARFESEFVDMVPLDGRLHARGERPERPQWPNLA